MADVVGGGVYRHWKGPEYLVLGLAHDANDEARTAVVYVPLYSIDGPPFAVRTLEDFTAWVDPADGRTVPAGEGVQRFAPVR
ncbi:MAG TPA: DUF1653 domain-containing protein [Mycobacteriales bacterium]|nr:DUF1653 domain-containing protein [Mycobacteriales bacterium]